MQKLPEAERALIVRKYSAPCFANLTEELIEITAGAILLKLHVITGWALPEDKHLRDELNRQLGLKLKESYQTVNINEVEYAFRNNTRVQDWGKKMNLSLIDEVMIPYLSNRAEASEAERIASQPKELPKIEISDEDVIETAQSIYLATKNYHYIAPGAYDRLIARDMVMLAGDKESIRNEAKNAIMVKLKDDPELFKDIDPIGYENRLCKKIACARYFDLKEKYKNL